MFPAHRHWYDEEFPEPLMIQEWYWDPVGMLKVRVPGSGNATATRRMAGTYKHDILAGLHGAS